LLSIALPRGGDALNSSYIGFHTDHGLYGSTSCCISQWPKYNGKWRFSTTRSGKTTEPILIKLDIYKYTLEATRYADFDFDTATWVVWANSQFATKFLSFIFFVSFAKATGRTQGRSDGGISVYIPTQNQ